MLHQKWAACVEKTLRQAGQQIQTTVGFPKQQTTAIGGYCAPVESGHHLARSQRPLNHGDYDSWRSIVGQKLSADGKFLVYGLFPQEGDGEVVIRNLATGKEQREPAGQRPAPVPPAPDQEG